MIDSGSTDIPDRFEKALTKSREQFSHGLSKLLRNRENPDQELFENLETLLLTADLGTETALWVIERVRRGLSRKSLTDRHVVWDALRTELTFIVEAMSRPFHIGEDRPFVILLVGVNGSGKTTTIGKLAARLKRQKHSVLLAAGDTFRAAAIEQLQTWGARNDLQVVAQRQGADSASVIYAAIESARAKEIDVVIADTAGRLQANAGLMQELAKVKRIAARLDPRAPHECLLVLDGGVGQNGLSQVEAFSREVGITGLIVTKLDGTARAGIVFALARRFALPIYFVGLGEGIDDLHPLYPQAFVDALLDA